MLDLQYYRTAASVTVHHRTDRRSQTNDICVRALRVPGVILPQSIIRYRWLAGDAALRQQQSLTVVMNVMYNRTCNSISQCIFIKRLHISVANHMVEQ